MTKQVILLSQFHGQIVDFNIWIKHHSAHQINLANLQLCEAKKILAENHINQDLAQQMRVSQLIILNHRQEINAITKDTEHNFRLIK